MTPHGRGLYALQAFTGPLQCLTGQDHLRFWASALHVPLRDGQDAGSRRDQMRDRQIRPEQQADRPEQQHQPPGNVHKLT